MQLIYLKSTPLKNIRIHEIKYENVKKRANAFVHIINDRVKKICNYNIPSVNNICLCNDENNNTKPYSYQIILIDPTQEQIKTTKKQLLQIQKKQFSEKIEQFTNNIYLIEKHIDKI